MRIDYHAGRLAWSVVALAAMAFPAFADSPPAPSPITAEQIEADWLRQDAVRWLEPSPRTRPAGVGNVAVTSAQDAAGAVDGVKDGTYGFHTSGNEAPWWQVDLGEPLPLDCLLVFNRCDGNVEGRAAHVKVSLSSDGETWAEVYRHDGTAFLGKTDGKPLTVSLDGARARFVRLQLPGKGYFHLDEVEIHAVGSEQNVALRRPADQSSASPWSRNSLPELVVEPPEEEVADLLTRQRLEWVVERALLLADNLTGLGVDVGAEAATLRQVAAATADLPHDSLTSVRRELYMKARWAQRRMSLANPLLDFDDLLFVKRIPGTFTHMSDQYYGWWSRPGGGLYILKNFKTERPELVCLSSELSEGSVLRPDVSFDGTKVLFAHCKYYPGLRGEPDKLNKENVPEDAFYHVYEMNLDGTGLRRLTRGKYDDFDARYLPDGRIVFLSTRRGQHVQTNPASVAACIDGAQPDCYVRCGGGPSRPVAVYTLHTMNADGSAMEQISPFEMFEWTPSVDDQGRILYSRWDYVDRYNMPYMSLWSTMPDGTGVQAVFGNFTLNPHCVFEARSIPGSQKLLFTAGGHHSNTGGSLVLLDVNRATDGDAAMERITPEVAFPETEGWPLSYFANPVPLSENHYLVAWSDKEMIGWPGPAEPENAHGVYLYDRFGNLTLLHRDPTISSVTPLPIRARVAPPNIPAKVVQTGDQEGRMLLLDVYEGLDSIPRGTIRRLRLVGVPSKSHPTMNFPELGLTRDDPGKFVMGTVPVAEDGSAFFRVPSGVTFFLQALDQQGKAVQTMRSGAYVQPGQTQTCVGCHEQRHTAPPNTAVAAMRDAPSPITPGVDGSWPLDFAGLVQPVLDARCTSCHQPGEEGESLDLTAAAAYNSLVDYGEPSLRTHVLARYHDGRSVAGACASSVSPLVRLLEEGHHDVELSADDWERLFTWMDTYAQRTGSFGPDQEERLRALRLRMGPMLAE